MTAVEAPSLWTIQVLRPSFPSFFDVVLTSEGRANFLAGQHLDRLHDEGGEPGDYRVTRCTLPWFPTFREAPTADGLERAVEKLTDRADRFFLNKVNGVTQVEYDAYMRALDRWTETVTTRKEEEARR